jgi:hypothetical protein
MEIDSDLEMVRVTIAAGELLNGGNLRILALGNGIGDAIPEVKVTPDPSGLMVLDPKLARALGTKKSLARRVPKMHFRAPSARAKSDTTPSFSSHILPEDCAQKGSAYLQKRLKNLI